jgi:hypothetical protein
MAYGIPTTITPAVASAPPSSTTTKSSGSSSGGPVSTIIDGLFSAAGLWGELWVTKEMAQVQAQIDATTANAQAQATIAQSTATTAAANAQAAQARTNAWYSPNGFLPDWARWAAVAILVVGGGTMIYRAIK